MHPLAGFGLAMCLALSLVACTSDGPAVASGGCDASENLTYSNFGAQFVHEYCLSCHAGSLVGAARQGAPAGYVFDTVEQIRLHADDMQDDVVETQVMPFGPNSLKPSDALRDKFGRWLECGAPE